MQLLGAGILPGLQAVPADLLQIQPQIPETGLVIVQRGRQRSRVGHGGTVHLYLVPGNEHSVFVAAAFLAAYPFAVEIVSHTVGRAFHHNQ